MGCCFCTYGKTSGSDDDSSSPKDYLSVAEFEEERWKILREMTHVKVDDIVQNEQIEELQRKVLILQETMLKVLDWCDRCTCSPGYGIAHLEKPPIETDLLWLPYDLYRRYLIGDPENDTDMDPQRLGYRTDAEVHDNFNVKPPEILPYIWPQKINEHDRHLDRKKVISLFLNIGNENGSGMSDLDDILDMVNNTDTDPEAVADQAYALDLIIQLYHKSEGEKSMIEDTDES